MKTRILHFFGLALMALTTFAANVRIKDLTTTIVLPASNTFLMADGATQGTGKTAMANFSFITGTRTTLAALSVTSLSTGVSVQTLGGSTIGDGSGSLYYYSSSSTATPNGTTIIQPSVGSGRWLIVTNSAIPAPSVSTLGGVFSIAPVTHYFLTSIGTNGQPTAAIPAAADISGLGTMATQSSAAVAITGGTLSGMTSYAGGTFSGTTITSSDRVNITGAAGTNRELQFQTSGTPRWKYRVNTDAESGTFTGSNFDFVATSNNGLTNVIALNINRATLTAAFTGAVSSPSFQGPIGLVTPQVGNFTTSTWSTNANKRTTKSNLNLTTVNVRDYGAIGDGATDATAAINSAIAALTSYSSLYFPPGKYLIAGTLSGFSSLNTVTVWGEGAELYNTGHGNTFVFAGTCTNINVTGLRFTGDATVRANGIHIRMYCSNSSITNCYFQGCSDFAIHLSNDAGTYSTNVLVANNVINGSLGDGIHFGAVYNGQAIGNVISNTGDDALAAIADDVTRPPARISFIGNIASQVGNGGSHACGVRINEGTDILIEANNFYVTQQSAIEVNRYLSTTAYNARVSIVGNKCFNANNAGLGPRGAIWVNFCQQANIVDNQVIDTVNGAAIALLDVSDTVVHGNFIRKAPFRGIIFDDGTTTNVATSWTQISITDNDFDWVQANEAIYMVPPSTVTVTNLMVTGNTAHIVGGNWIYYDRITTGRVWNNTNTSGATVAAGGTVSGVTAGNNN